MGIYKVVLPRMGESVSEATITKWVKAIGDSVEEDDPIVEIATDKVDSDVPAPVTGKLSKIFFEENQVAQVGDVIAWIEVEGETNEDTTTPDTEEVADAVSQPEPEVSPDIEEHNVIEEELLNKVSAAEERGVSTQQIPGTELLEQELREKTVLHSGSRFYSPLVKNIAQEEGLSQAELDSIIGTGAEGRVTKQDILDYLGKRSAQDPRVESEEIAVKTASSDQHVITPPSKEKENTPKITAPGDEIVEMDRMRRLIADHMVHSVKTSPHVASFVEADVTNLVNWRNKIKDSYKKREGENITFTPIFIEAVSKALRDFPMVNVSVDGHHIIKRKNINIGMAAALPSGNLIVPVIKNADQLSLVGLSKAVNDLAQRSRQNQLKPDDTQGGTFTFTNIGAFGNIMGVPIINQPQAAILAVGTIKKKPAVLETEHGDVIAIRHMMYLSMSYDHRVIDGALGGTFLKRVADYLENWDINREI
ncbi:dihydrolipoamide acetyltransferase family protein [Sphingobacterium corticibacterium]|uniref:Dihydrolipoamide acetyltransferase component of pyruvate dehydrogenase complex n=1 Tax=Sphingobacterium corticibacterium TaxID=2484746 RepID=A0A4Q6XKW0_9SPHI|nr:dihydrolipoamide acetyltransferase family protein [Sphingobacterium corticibacterium]RZF57422.1 2-oxo acid dehydrogenase subunit E2 [Sphingobacterium corticibacterium]